MGKNFILDTNVLLHDPDAILKFDDNTVIITFEVLEELDNFKKDVTDLGANARRAIQRIDQLRSGGDLKNGIRLPNGGVLKVMPGYFDNTLVDAGLRDSRQTGHRLLGLACQLQQNTSKPAILVTKNINLRLKADALGIVSADYKETADVTQNGYTGYQELEVSSETLANLRADGSVTLEGHRFYPNECLLLRDKEGNRLLARIADEEGHVAVRIPHFGDGILGIEPRNLAQSFAFECLLNDDIKLVTLQGRAGTGKTLLAVAAGLYKVIEEDRYHKLLVARPTMPMGRDIGFIPGDVDEKLRPWMKPIYDAVDLLQEIDRRSRKRRLPPDLLESKELDIEPLTYIRGRSIPHQYIIIDEAQNLSPLEVKTIITRVGNGTKIVLTGDPEQIDNPYLNTTSNGFIHVVNKFKDQAIAAHITFMKGERSPLAEAAANLL